jgi:hypothetical protein
MYNSKIHDTYRVSSHDTFVMTSSLLLNMREYKFLKVISELPDLGNSCLFHTLFFHTLGWFLLCHMRCPIVCSRRRMFVGDVNIDQGF